MIEESESKSRILFLGLGVMGGPMAANLVNSARYSVHAHDIDPDKVAPLMEMGAEPVGELEQAIQQADIVMTSLPGPKQVEEVAFGQSGLMENMTPGSAWIDLSTNNLQVCARIVDAATERRIRFLDAPVSGGDEGARAGTLTILVGGSKQHFDESLPVLETIGKSISHLGPNGAGYSAKIAQVVLCYVHSLALSEALMLGVSGGVDVEQMLKIIQNSTGHSYVSDRYGPCILDGGYDPSFTVGLALKDMNLAMDMARDCSVELPLCELTTETYKNALESYGFGANHLKAVRLLEEANQCFLQSGSDR